MARDGHRARNGRASGSARAGDQRTGDPYLSAAGPARRVAVAVVDDYCEYLPNGSRQP
jgi:hypothetical protein